MQKPQTLKGFRDFLPKEKRRRDQVQANIIEIFERFGFAPVQTPTLEYAQLLLGKYGDEADKLVYTFEDRGGREVGLRYDQTVPTARLLGQYSGTLPKYFRRYQIQSVFRADKPQKGRYREFTQCDCDIFGSSDPLADAEILATIYSIFENLNLGKVVTIEYNDRQTLIAAFTPFATQKVSVLSIIQSIDKADKLTPDQIKAELVAKGLTQQKATQCWDAIEQMQQSPQIATIIELAKDLGVPASALKWNRNIARGLDYYTGIIFEVKIAGYDVGAVTAGGRYDKLISDLTGTSVSAVGVAVGFDRVVEVVEQLNALPEPADAQAQVLVAHFPEFRRGSLQAAQALRDAGIPTEVFPDSAKLSKQFKYANTQNIPYVVIVGETEQANGTIQLKNMKTQQQQELSLEALVAQLKEQATT